VFHNRLLTFGLLFGVLAALIAFAILWYPGPRGIGPEPDDTSDAVNRALQQKTPDKAQPIAPDDTVAE